MTNLSIVFNNIFCKTAAQSESTQSAQQPYKDLKTIVTDTDLGYNSGRYDNNNKASLNYLLAVELGLTGHPLFQAINSDSNFNNALTDFRRQVLLKKKDPDWHKKYPRLAAYSNFNLLKPLLATNLYGAQGLNLYKDIYAKHKDNTAALHLIMLSNAMQDQAYNNGLPKDYNYDIKYRPALIKQQIADYYSNRDKREKFQQGFWTNKTGEEALRSAMPWYSLIRSDKDNIEDFQNTYIGYSPRTARLNGYYLGANLLPLDAARIAKNPEEFFAGFDKFYKSFSGQLDLNLTSNFAIGLTLGILHHMDNLLGLDRLAYINNIIKMQQNAKLPKALMTNELKAAIKKLVTSKAWDVVKSDWTKFNKFVAIWARSKGWDNFGAFADNNLLFYGSLAAAILGGGLLTASAISSSRNNQPIYAPQQTHRPQTTGSQYGYYG